MAMKMLAIEDYSSGGTIYDPSSSNGLKKGSQQRLAALCDAPGTLVLTGWDKTVGDALSFTYREGNYIVFFRLHPEVEEGTVPTDMTDEENEDAHWEIYLYLRVKDF